MRLNSSVITLFIIKQFTACLETWIKKDPGPDRHTVTELDGLFTSREQVPMLRRDYFICL